MADYAVRVEGLVKRFGEITALAGIDLEVPQQSVFGVLGPNGAGKTTLMRILSTIIRPDAGRAEVAGRDVVRDPDGVRYAIGLAGQYAAVDPQLTGRENLRLVGWLAQMSGRDSKTRADELLERFRLTDAAHRPVRTYSGGMRRRLDVAAALVHRPPVVFLDEPTTGLDPRSREELWAMIRELVAEGATVLLTTQYLEEADRLADRIAVINEGRVIANDTPAALKTQLGDTVVELTMADERAASRAVEILSADLGPGTERQIDVVRLPSDGGTPMLVRALRVLDQHDMAPATLAVRAPSLDDVFLSLTGPHARDGARTQPATPGGDRADSEGEERR